MGGEHFDLVVIGRGPADEKAAAQAAYFDKRVALVEKSSTLGGTMVGGVVSRKTMREAALYLTSLRHRGVHDIGLDLPANAAMARLRSRTDRVVGTVAETTAANMARHGVTVVTDELGREGPVLGEHARHHHRDVGTLNVAWMNARVEQSR